MWTLLNYELDWERERTLGIWCCTYHVDFVELRAGLREGEDTWHLICCTCHVDFVELRAGLKEGEDTWHLICCTYHVDFVELLAGLREGEDTWHLICCTCHVDFVELLQLYVCSIISWISVWYCCEIWRNQSSGTEDSGLPGCDSVSGRVAKCSPNNAVSHPRACVSSVLFMLTSDYI
jgi:hypothetical protein